MKKTVNHATAAVDLPAPGLSSCRTLLAIALVGMGGLANPAIAADETGVAPDAQVAQADAATASSGAALGCGRIDPSVTSASTETYTIRPLPLPEQYAGAAAAGNEPCVEVAQNVSPSSNAPPSGSPLSPSSQTGPTQMTPPVGGAGGGVSAYTIPPPPVQAQNPYALADSLKYRGWIVPIPGAADTFDQGLGGLRNTLAENGISYFGFTDTTFQDNLIQHEHPPGANPNLSQNSKLQQYSGQLPTYTTANTIFVMYDLQRYGIPDGQFTVAGSVLETNWNPGDPDGIGIGQISYYQTLFHKKVEFKIGYLTNNLEYLGTQIGGSLSAGLFGVSAAIPFETGQNLGSFATPAVNVKVYLPHHFYTKFGVQRGTSPDGLQVERLQNPSNARFDVPNAGVLVIDETGYRVPPAPGQDMTWVRVAANYTSSRYADLTSGIRHPTNYGLYALADHQILQTAPRGGPRTAYQGIYVGATAMFAPSYINAFTQYYEARLYAFGIIPHRPFDFTSFVYNENRFSGVLEHELNEFRLLTHHAANSYTLSHSAHIYNGVNVNFGVSYTDNPTPITYDTHSGSSLSVLANLFVWF